MKKRLLKSPVVTFVESKNDKLDDELLGDILFVEKHQEDEVKITFIKVIINLEKYK